jgi:hypothetical protein
MIASPISYRIIHHCAKKFWNIAMYSSRRTSLLQVSIIVTIGIYLVPVRAQSPNQCDRKFDYSRVPMEVRLGYLLPLAPLGSLDDLESSPAVPLDVTLVAVDKPAYAINESIVFDVRFTNNSGQSVVLPVSHRPIYPSKEEYPPLLDAYPKGYRHILFQLHVKKGSVGVISKTIDTLSVIGPVAINYALFGSPDVPGSLRRLDPGHCLTFRIHGCLEIGFKDDRKEILNETSTAMSATLAVYLYQPKDPVFGKFMWPAVSNSLPIAILGREVPIVKQCVGPLPPYLNKTKTKKARTRNNNRSSR